MDQLVCNLQVCKSVLIEFASYNTNSKNKSTSNVKKPHIRKWISSHISTFHTVEETPSKRLYCCKWKKNIDILNFSFNARPNISILIVYYPIGKIPAVYWKLFILSFTLSVSSGMRQIITVSTVT